MAELVDELKRQDERAQLLGDKYDPRGFVFCQDDGKPIDPSTDYEELGRILDAIGVKRRGTHAAGRHTTAKLADLFGVDLVEINRLLRQRDIRITRGYIADDFDGTETRGAAKVFDLELFRGKRAADTQPGTDTDLGTAKVKYQKRRRERRSGT
jgi:hypothetical protein